MLKDPIICPFCAGNLLQELEPSALGTDKVLWSVFHWQCLECGETFDKMVEEAYSDDFYENESTDFPTDS